MISAFGERAQRWAAGARIDDDVIAVDETALLEAMAEAVERRSRGEAFALALFLDEDPNRFVRAWGSKLLGAAKTFDDRRSACGSIAMGSFVVDGKSQVELSGVTADTFELGRALWHLAERGVVVSEAAYARVATLYSRWHAERVFPDQDDPDVPKPRGGHEGPEHVVIWAGARSADEIAVILCALEELHLPVYVVCDGGTVPSTIHRCTLAQAEPLLRAAAAIVDATDDRPGTAVALARFGAPLAVARSSGAREFLDGVAGFDGWIRDSILAATLEAIGAFPPGRPLDSAALRSGSRDRTNGATVRDRAPLVSVITPTYNRREPLTRALESIARQNYPAIEKIVVNDAGESVADIAERFSAIAIEREKNGGHGASLNSGIERARGEYVAFLDDDDLFFPDHVSSLVDALEHSRGQVAHANSLMAVRGEPDEIVGFSPGTFASIDLEDALVVCPMLGMISTMIRRDLFAEIGNFDESLAPNDDHEMILRIALRYDWIHVDRITALWSYGGNYTHVFSTAAAEYPSRYEETYKRHPQPDRPILAAKRRQFVETMRLQGARLKVVSARLEQPLRLMELAK